MDQLALKVQLALTALRDLLVLLVIRALKDQWALKALSALQGLRDLQDRLQLGRLDQPALLVIKVQLAVQALEAHKAQLAVKVPSVIKAQLVIKAQWGLEALQVLSVIIMHRMQI